MLWGFLICLVCIAIFCFFLTAGIIILKSQFKPVDTSANTGNETSEIPGVSSSLTAHVRDPVIMAPLLAAKKDGLPILYKKLTYVQRTKHLFVHIFGVQMTTLVKKP